MTNNGKGRWLTIGTFLAAVLPPLPALAEPIQHGQATSEFKRMASSLERRFKANRRGMDTVEQGGRIEGRGRSLKAAKLVRAEKALERAHSRGAGAMFSQAGAVMKFGKALTGPLGLFAALNAQSKTWIAQEEAHYAEANAVFLAKRAGVPVGPNLRRRALHSLQCRLNSVKRERVEATVRLKNPRHGFFGMRYKPPAHWQAQLKTSRLQAARLKRKIRALQRAPRGSGRR